MDQDEPKPMASIISFQQHALSSRKGRDPQTEQIITLLLTKLAINYHRPDFSAGQAKSLIEDMLDDLGDYSVRDIEEAIKAYRTNGKNRFFPTSGQLVDLIKAAIKDRAYLDSHPDIARAEFGDIGEDGKPISRPTQWWLLRRQFWKQHWSEDEIPAHEREPYFRWKAAKEARAEL